MLDQDHERPNLNTGTRWADMDLCDLRICLEVNCDSVADTAMFRCRTEREVRDKAAELGIECGGHSEH